MHMIYTALPDIIPFNIVSENKRIVVPEKWALRL